MLSLQLIQLILIHLYPKMKYNSSKNDASKDIINWIISFEIISLMILPEINPSIK